MNNNFRDMGSFLIQIGLYLTTKENDTFEKTEIHQNILDFLLQSYLYLNKISSFGYDTQEMFYKGKRKGKIVSWNINEKQVISINLSTKVLNKKEKLKIKIYKGSD